MMAARTGRARRAHRTPGVGAGVIASACIGAHSTATGTSPDDHLTTGPDGCVAAARAWRVGR
jgi:hypothetical protein